jgi:hypothetical protein
MMMMTLPFVIICCRFCTKVELYIYIYIYIERERERERKREREREREIDREQQTLLHDSLFLFKMMTLDFQFFFPDFEIEQKLNTK